MDNCFANDKNPESLDGNVWAKELSQAVSAFAADHSTEHYTCVLSLLLTGMQCYGSVRGRFADCEAEHGEKYLVMVTGTCKMYRNMEEKTLISTFFSFNKDDYAGLIINPATENIVIEKEFFLSALRLFYAGIRLGEEGTAETN